MLNKKYKKRLSEGFYPPPKRNRVAAIITTGEINNTNKNDAATKADMLAIITSINHNAAILDDIMSQVEDIEKRERTSAAPDLHQGVAHWIHTKESKIYYEHWKCSNCMHDILENPRFKNINEKGVSLDFKYCPYCGSRMDDEIKENTATEDQEE